MDKITIKTTETDDKEQDYFEEVARLLDYLELCKDDEPFELRQLPDKRYQYLRHDKNGFQLISLYREQPIEIKQHINEGYYRAGHKYIHRLVCELYGNIPKDVNFQLMQIHHSCLHHTEKKYGLRQ